MSKEFTIEDSEALIANFQSIKSGSNAVLAAALRELADVPAIPAGSHPKIWPSESNVISLAKFKNLRSRRAIYSAAIAVGLGVGAAVGAAALTGGITGVVEFAKSTVNTFSNAVEKVISVVTGNDDPIIENNNSSEPLNETIQLSPSPTSDPIPTNQQTTKNSQPLEKPESGSTDKEKNRAEAENDSDSETKSKSESNSEGLAENKSSTNSESKTETKTDSKTETKSESKTGANTESKSETKSETKTDSNDD